MADCYVVNLNKQQDKRFEQACRNNKNMGVPSATDMESTVETTGFNSSDDERDEEVDTSPFNISWLDLSEYGFSESLGLSGLPGCRFKETWRSLSTDIKTLKKEGIEDVFVFCTRGELKKFRVPGLFEGYSEAEINLHHYPLQDGNAPTIEICLKMLDEIKVNLSRGNKSLIHCFGGLGRTCLVAACLLLSLDSSMTAEQAIDRLRQLQGPRAIQTVRQFNFVNDFKKAREAYEAECDTGTRRSVSR